MVLSKKTSSLKCLTLLVRSFIKIVIPFLFLFLRSHLVFPIAVVTVDGEQTHTTTVMKKTLNPYWNESFDL